MLFVPPHFEKCGVLCNTLLSKNCVRESVHLSVRPSIHPSVHQRIVFTLCWELFEPFFFKLAMRVDIGKECPGIADG